MATDKYFIHQIIKLRRRFQHKTPDISFLYLQILNKFYLIMSERAHSVPSQDRLSKAVHRRCQEVTNFIGNGVETKNLEKNSSHSQQDQDELFEAVSSSSGEEEDDDDDEEEQDFFDLQNVLSRMEEKDMKTNKTFSDDKLREIERRNAILMDKLIKNSQRPNQYGTTPVPSKVASAAINRRRQQEKINRDNLVILFNKYLMAF